MKKFFTFIFSTIWFLHNNAQVVQFLDPSLTPSQHILLNYYYPEGEIKSVNVTQLKNALNNSYNNNSTATLQLNGNTSLEVEVNTIYQSASYNGNENILFKGTIDGNPNPSIKIRIDGERVSIIQNGDDGPCYEIVYINSSEYGINPPNEFSFVRIRIVPCPEDNINLVMPLPCEPFIGVVISCDQFFVNETFGNRDSALAKMMYVTNAAIKIWNDRLLQFQQKLNVHVYAYLLPDEKLNLSEQCVRNDFSIYFKAGEPFEGAFNGLRDICDFPNRLKGEITLNNSVNHFVRDNRLAITLAHELGHAFGAGETEDCLMNNIECMNNNYLMCSKFGKPNDINNVNWDACTWNQIRSYILGNNCICNPIIPPTCINCIADLAIVPEKTYAYLDCTNENEINLEVYYTNDCIPKTLKIILGIQNGGFPTRNLNTPKTSLINQGDFTLLSVTDGVSYYQTDSLYYIKDQQRLFKCKIRIDEGSTSALQCHLGSNISPFVKLNGINNNPSVISKIYYNKPTIMNNKNIDNLISEAPSCFFQNHTNCTLSEGNFRIQGEFTVNKDHCFLNSNIFLDPGAIIVVPSGKTLSLKKCHLKGCSSLWESIELRPGGQLIVDTSIIEDAEYAVHKLGSGMVSIKGSTIRDCNNGVVANNASSGSSFVIKNSVFNEISYVGIRQNNGTVSVFDCGFNNLSSGIVADNSALNIGGNILQNIGTNTGAPPSAVYPWLGNGISLIGSGSELVKSVASQDGKLLNIMSDLNVGVYINNGRYELDQIEVTNASRAVSIHSSSTTGNSIKFLSSKTNKYGIFANDNAGMSALFDNNTINVSDPDASGIYVGNNTGALMIKNNSIVNKTGIAGVHFNGVSNAVLEKTSVLVEVTNGTRSDGFYINNSDNNIVKCNAINSAAFGGGTIAIEVRESSGGSYLCNNITGADCGLIFAGTCDPSITGENSLSNHPVLGFGVSTPQNGSDGIIGPQFHKGNHLTGCSANADAWNYGSPFAISQSIIKVSNPSPFKPNNIAALINLGFFVNPEDSIEYNCTTNNTCPYGIGRSKEVVSEVNVSTELIKGNIGCDKYDDARTWSARKKILENIIRNNLRTSESDSWMRSFKGTDLFTHARSSVLLSLISSEELEYYKHELIIILNKIIAFKPSSIYEQNQQTVSRIRIQKLLDGRVLDKSEITILKSIAEQCAYSGGNAVYEARMILEGIVKLDINEDESCGLRSKDNRILEEVKESMSSYPNPTNKSFHVRIVNNDASLQYQARIVSLDGSMIKNLILVRDNEINLTDIASGIYLIKVNDKPEWTPKIIVIK